MPNEVLLKAGTDVVFGVSASLSPADVGTQMYIGSPTINAMTMTGVTDAAGRQSIKVDLGATRAAQYAVLAAIELQATPTSGRTVDFYWAPSPSGTGGTGNVFGNSGGDGALPTGALGSITAAEFIRLCQYIGSLPVTDDVVVQAGYVGIFTPSHRYGQMIILNNSGATLVADNVEHHVVMHPVVDELQ